MYLKAFKSADAIITVSGFSRKEIIDNYNTHGKEIVVAGNGWQHFDVNSIDESIFDKYASRIKDINIICIWLHWHLIES